jgi:hypothetical protein
MDAPGAMVSYQVITKSFVLPSPLSGLKVVTGGNKLFGTKLEPSVWNSTSSKTLPRAVLFPLLRAVLLVVL